MKKAALLVLIVACLAFVENYSLSSSNVPFVCDSAFKGLGLNVCFHHRMMTPDELYSVLASDSLSDAQKLELVEKYNKAVQISKMR